MSRKFESSNKWDKYTYCRKYTYYGINIRCFKRGETGELERASVVSAAVVEVAVVGAVYMRPAEVHVHNCVLSAAANTVQVVSVMQVLYAHVFPEYSHAKQTTILYSRGFQPGVLVSFVTL